MNNSTANQATPLEALEWLQGGGGLTLSEGESLKADIEAERQTKRNWWEG